MSDKNTSNRIPILVRRMRGINNGELYTPHLLKINFASRRVWEWLNDPPLEVIRRIVYHEGGVEVSMSNIHGCSWAGAHVPPPPHTHTQTNKFIVPQVPAQKSCIMWTKWTHETCAPTESKDPQCPPPPPPHWKSPRYAAANIRSVLPGIGMMQEWLAEYHYVPQHICTWHRLSCRCRSGGRMISNLQETLDCNIQEMRGNLRGRILRKYAKYSYHRYLMLHIHKICPCYSLKSTSWIQPFPF